MRNGQQKRMRGRNRRSSNPLTRVYESNGPDVKVRGTAHHITEKYQQLARDAQASGDPVAAENYFQHAEHYLRLIASLQGTFAPQQGFGRDEDMDDEDMDDMGGLDAPQPYAREQPYQGREQRDQREPREFREPREQREPREFREPREPREPRSEGRPPREGRPNNGPRRNRDEEGSEGFQPREFRAPRGRDEGGEGFAPRPARAPRAPRSEESAEGFEPAPPPQPAPRAARAPRVEPEAEQLGLPSFITGGPSLPVAKERVEGEGEAAERTEAGEGTEGARFPRRRRSRFRTRADRPEGEDAPAEAVNGAEQPSLGE